jgi:hypothetical protein
MRGNVGTQGIVLLDLRASVCVACENYSLWFNGKVIHPRSSTAPPPVAGMPESVKTDYMEAKLVFDDSPRAAAALLRLAVQKLCIHLGRPGKNLNSDVAQLATEGLPDYVRRALDVVRVVGNNSVHPGELDVRDDPKTAEALFHCVNWIVEAMIQRAQRISELYAKLPAGAKDAVTKRDRETARRPQ